MEALSKDKIAELCAANPVIKRAYALFAEKIGNKPILDMWEQAHFTLPIEEAFIKYLEGWRYKTFRYEKKNGKEKWETQLS